MAKTQLNVSNVKIDFLDIHTSFGTYDLIPHLEEFNIYENMFENHLSAHITLQDAFNIPYKLPIVGEEVISCQIRLEGDEGDFVISPPMFHVHELSDRFLKTNQSQRFSLDLVSEQYMSNIHTRVNKSYMEWPPDDIVSDIWNNYLDDQHGGLNSEEAKPIDCVIPGWTPYQVFNWLCERSQPEEHDVATNYVYFEGMDTTHFISLNRLAEQEPLVVFSKTQRVDDPSQVQALAAGWIKVDSITYMGQFQKVKSINKGQYASKLITHDIVKKKILQYDYDGFKEWGDLNHLGPYPPTSNSETELQTGNTFRTSYAPSLDDSTKVIEGRRLSDYTDSDVSFYPKHDRMYSVNPEQKHDNKVETWKQRRSNQMALYDGVQMMVRCAGVSFLRVGMTVKLNVPSPESTSQSNWSDSSQDKFLSGTYMVTSIRHIFANDKGNTGYKMLVVLTKDGLDSVVTERTPRKLNLMRKRVL